MMVFNVYVNDTVPLI